jgi:hypothetical protein
MLIRGDARSLPLVDACVDCVVTSPPYWGLRDSAPIRTVRAAFARHQGKRRTAVTTRCAQISINLAAAISARSGQSTRCPTRARTSPPCPKSSWNPASSLAVRSAGWYLIRSSVAAPSSAWRNGSAGEAWAAIWRITISQKRAQPSEAFRLPQPMWTRGAFPAPGRPEMLNQGTFFGRPPFLPFARAAAALAGVETPLPARPPLRPSATAWGFLRGIYRTSSGSQMTCPYGSPKSTISKSPKSSSSRYPGAPRGTAGALLSGDCSMRRRATTLPAPSILASIPYRYGLLQPQDVVTKDGKHVLEKDLQ